jgi:hypothetical protein
VPPDYDEAILSRSSVRSAGRGPPAATTRVLTTCRKKWPGGVASIARPRESTTEEQIPNGQGNHIGGRHGHRLRQDHGRAARQRRDAADGPDPLACESDAVQPCAYSDAASKAMRILATASTEVARLKAGRRL